MSEPFVFDSRCDQCKTPYGAARCGETVTLHVRPLGCEGFTHCALVLFQEFSGVTRELELTPVCWDGERFRFSLSFPAPEEPELVWYHFRLWREDGSGCVLDRSGYCSQPPYQDWQLTVYEPRPCPEWFGAGVTYQIFPDRFCCLSVPDPAGMVGDRTVHQNWEDTPEWRPDPAGEIRNRDFFGGSLAGLLSRLDTLAALGVTTLYLCPVFEAASNHRYNTADYLRIDPMLGDEEDFRQLCREAHSRGMRVLLDGVFNHTGSQSVYFNADGFYPSLGAAQSRESPYFSWYHFHPWPEDYDAWWGIRTLPAVEESEPSYVNFIIDGENSVVRHWLRCGADGWRLDVADELPDWFIVKLRQTLEETCPDGLLIGEVWEDGTTKVAYSQRRKYLLGREVHGLMNYPFRTAALAWLQGGDALDFLESMEALREHYPPAAFQSAMNFLGTHDTPRILTLLGADHAPDSREERAAHTLSPKELTRGLARLRVAAVLLYAFPGSPTVFYGDEAGLQGWEDPFNRRGYPYGRENTELLSWYTRLGQLRKQRCSLQVGQLRWLYACGHGLAFARDLPEETTVAVFNAGDTPLTLPLPHSGPVRDLLTGAMLEVPDGKLTLPAYSAVLLDI